MKATEENYDAIKNKVTKKESVVGVYARENDSLDWGLWGDSSENSIYSIWKVEPKKIFYPKIFFYGLKH